MKELYIKNLRDLHIKTGDGESIPQQDYSCEAEGVNIQVFFDNHKAQILKHIDEYNSVIGCVSWLIDFDVLRALTKKKFVSIIVQKEKFLKSFQNRKSSHFEETKELYKLLPSSDRRLLPFFVPSLSHGTDTTIEAIRCMGNLRRHKHSPAIALMHHKFLVFTNDFEDTYDIAINAGKTDLTFVSSWTPSTEDVVWTGSYNITANAQYSIENTLLLQSPKIVESYIKEWVQLMALSEPLDFHCDWCEPQWHIGA